MHQTGTHLHTDFITVVLRRPRGKGLIDIEILVILGATQKPFRVHAVEEYRWGSPLECKTAENEHPYPEQHEQDKEDDIRASPVFVLSKDYRLAGPRTSVVVKAHLC